MLGRVVARIGATFIIRYICPEKDCDFICDYDQDDPSKVMTHIIIHQADKKKEEEIQSQ